MDNGSTFPVAPSGQHTISTAAAFPFFSTTVFAGFLVTSLQLEGLEKPFIIDLLFELTKGLFNIVVADLDLKGSIRTQSVHLPFFL